MSDWADEEAARLSNLDRDTREESQWVCDQIASALRSAFQRGKVDGLRDAAAMARFRACDDDCNCYSCDEDRTLCDLIASRATALEQENKD
jgi:hypothetical protein